MTYGLDLAMAAMTCPKPVPAHACTRLILAEASAAGLIMYLFYLAAQHGGT